MNAGAPMWVRVGGGMESIPEHLRHGPADPDFPPPGGPWMPLNLGRRAAALEAAAVQSKDGARGVVLGAVLNLATPSAARDLPANAVVVGSEPALVEAFTRAQDWLGPDGLSIAAEPLGSWGEGRIEAGPPPRGRCVAE